MRLGQIQFLRMNTPIPGLCKSGLNLDCNRTHGSFYARAISPASSFYEGDLYWHFFFEPHQVILFLILHTLRALVSDFRFLHLDQPLWLRTYVFLNKIHRYCQNRFLQSLRTTLRFHQPEWSLFFWLCLMNLQVFRLCVHQSLRTFCLIKREVVLSF